MKKAYLRERIYSKTISEQKFTKYRDVMRKGINVLDAGLHLMMAIKQRNLLTMGTAITSVYSALDSIFEPKSERVRDLEDFLLDMGAKPYFGAMTTFIYSALLACEVDKEIFVPPQMEESDEANARKAYKFNIGNGVYVVVGGETQSPYDIYYVGSKEEFTNVLFEAFENLGSVLALRLRRNWGALFASVEQMDIDTDNYAGTLAAEQFCETINKFRKQGHNRSSLFVGAPGVGKTTFAAKISELLGGRLFAIEALALRDAISEGYDMGALLQILKPQVILLDDLDRIDSLEYMLSEISRYRQAYEQAIIIGAVNDLTVVPNALRRPGRFDEIIEFHLPNKQERLELIRLYSEAFKAKIMNGHTESIADATEGMSHAEIREVVLQATILSFNELMKKISHIKRMANIPDYSSRQKIDLMPNDYEADATA